MKLKLLIFNFKVRLLFQIKIFLKQFSSVIGKLLKIQLMVRSLFGQLKESEVVQIIGKIIN